MLVVGDGKRAGVMLGTWLVREISAEEEAPEGGASDQASRSEVEV